MTLIELIVNILEASATPLKNDEIYRNAMTHSQVSSCEELNRVEVPKSAIARCLSRNSRGSNPVLGVLDEGKDKISFKRFFLRHKIYPHINLTSESDLHHLLALFVDARFNVLTKTINASKSVPKKDKLGRWTNPDMVGVNPVILNLSALFQHEVEKLGILSTKVIQFYIFELKLTLNKHNLTENYFQAVSNSSWANFGYLVVADMNMDKNFLEHLSRLRDGYGIGVIKLDTTNPLNSEVVIAARERETVDINFMDFLSDNKDFHHFVQSAIAIVKHKKISLDAFDTLSLTHIGHNAT
jgi:hypothetical protein